MITDQSQTDELVKEIQTLVETEEVLRVKISAARMVEQKMNEKLEHLRSLRKEEQDKIEGHKKQINALEKARYYSSRYEQSVGANMKRKRAVLNDFQKLVKNNDLEGLISEVAEFENIKEEFCSQKSGAPWLPEKKMMLGELKQQESDLARIKEEIVFMRDVISEREKLLVQHKKIPFNKFCLTLGNYLHKTKQMDITMKNELKIQESLLEKTKRMEQDLSQHSLSLGVERVHDDAMNCQIIEDISEHNVAEIHDVEALSETTHKKATPDRVENKDEQNDLLMQFEEVDVFTGAHDEGDDDAVRVEVVPNNFSFGFNFNSPIHESTNKDVQNEETFGFNFNF